MKESGVAEQSAQVGTAVEESGMAAGDLCLLLRFALLVSLLMREGGVDEELAGVGMAARMDRESGMVADSSGVCGAAGE